MHDLYVSITPLVLPPWPGNVQVADNGNKSRMPKIPRPQVKIMGLRRLPRPNEYCPCGSQKRYKKCCLYETAFGDRGSKTSIAKKIFGGVEIYRPREESDQRFRNKYEAHMRRSFEPKTYTDWQTIDKIVKCKFEFCRQGFEELLPKIAERGFLEMVLDQFDKCGQLDDLVGENILSGSARSEWLDLGRTFKRTLKFLAERTTMQELQPIAESSPEDDLDLLDDVFIYAEELVGACILSDQVRLFRDTSQIVIQHPGSPTVLDHTDTKDSFSTYGPRIAKHRSTYSSVYEGKLYLFDFESHAKHLDEALQENIGASYSECINILKSVEDGTEPNWRKNAFPIVFVKKEEVVTKLAAGFKKDAETIEKVLSGFILRKEDMLHEGRDYWNPKFHYRAYRRGIFQFLDGSDVYLTWSKYTFREALFMLRVELPFGQFPDEWRSERVNKSIEKIKKDRADWFELMVREKLSEIGIFGLVSKTSIGINDANIKVTAGELDFIGWSETDDALVLIECKMLQDGTESKIWQSHVDKFLKKDGSEPSFLDKLKKKAEWVIQNSDRVYEALRSEGIGISKKPTKLNVSFITYAPNAASYFIEDFPCPSLPEFLEDYRNNGNRWPYNKGTFSI